MTKYKHGIGKKYGFLWVTLILFSGSILGQWYFGFATNQSWQENLTSEFNKNLELKDHRIVSHFMISEFLSGMESRKT